MPIQPDPARPGLWTNPEWTPESGAGTFAVVIGVSSYYHLTGGSKQLAAESYSLGQLHVSALTAYRFFEWLCARYRHSRAPLARCWLLLSPTPEEVQYESALAGAPTASLQECRVAIREWFAAMEALSPEFAEKSRALFFFSGHGLEIATDRQILLPCDYLQPPVPALNDAISTYNLYGGLRKLAIGEQIFLLDACRNDHATLRQADLRGNDILTVWPAYMSNPDVVAPLVYATASGSQSWEPTAPQTGISLFGQALLEGLRAEAGMSADCAEVPCSIKLLSLAPFLDERVRALHQERGSRVRQAVRLGGTVAQLSVTEVPAGGPATPTSDTPPGTRFAGSPGGLLGVAPPSPAAGRLKVRGPAAFRTIMLPPAGVRSDAVGDFESMHRVFGSETVTRMWQHARLLALSPEHTAAGGPSRFTIRHVERAPDAVRHDTPDGMSFRVLLDVDAPGAHWLELALGGERYACVLPGDIHSRPLYELEFSREKGTGLYRLEAGLAEGRSDLLTRASRLWKHYRHAQLGSPVVVEDARALVGIVRQKTVSPLAATVAALIVLRASLHDVPLDWFRNLAGVARTELAHVFRQRPDGCVVLAERLLREIGKHAHGNHSTAGARVRPLRDVHPVYGDEIVRLLLDLERRGLPHTTDGLAYVSRQLKELLAGGIGPGAAGVSAEEQHERLRRLDQRVDRAVSVLRNGGLFASFIGPAEIVTPALVAAEPVPV